MHNYCLAKALYSFRPQLLHVEFPLCKHREEVHLGKNNLFGLDFIIQATSPWMLFNKVVFLLQAQNDEFASIFNLEDYKGVLFNSYNHFAMSAGEQWSLDILDTQRSSVPRNLGGLNFDGLILSVNFCISKWLLTAHYVSCGILEVS